MTRPPSDIVPALLQARLHQRLCEPAGHLPDGPARQLWPGRRLTLSRLCYRRAFTSACVNQLATYLTDLRASCDPAAGVLTAQLKTSQAALERLRHLPAGRPLDADSSFSLGLSPARR